MAVSISCKQSGCPVATTGACMEGVKPVNKCPNAITSSLSETTAVAKAPVRTKVASKPPKIEFVSSVALPSGEELSIDQAAELRRTVGGVVVALAGDEDVGKTTLIASLYDRFLDGPWAGFRFAGSETLVGFEKRLHLARMASGASKQDTDRTSRIAPVHFLHLSLARLQSSECQNLILADLPGERFHDSADNQDICRKELKHIKYADRLAICLDGESLIDLKARQGAVSLIKGLLNNLLEVGYLDRGSVVDMLITKWDRVQSDPKSALHTAFIDKTEAMLRTEFADRLGCLTCFRVAARPDEASELGLCHQMELLLSNWCVPKPPLVVPPLQFTESADLRESERYLHRRLPQYVARKEK